MKLKYNNWEQINLQTYNEIKKIVTDTISAKVSKNVEHFHTHKICSTEIKFSSPKYDIMSSLFGGPLLGEPIFPAAKIRFFLFKQIVQSQFLYNIGVVNGRRQTVDGDHSQPNGTSKFRFRTECRNSILQLLRFLFLQCIFFIGKFYLTKIYNFIGAFND